MAEPRRKKSGTADTATEGGRKVRKAAASTQVRRRRSAGAQVVDARFANPGPDGESSTQVRRGLVLNLPMVPLRGINLFPHMAITFDVGREASKAAIRKAMESDQLLFLVAQRDPTVEEPALADLYPIGCIARVRQIIELPTDEGLKVLVEGMNRARIMEIHRLEGYRTAESLEVFPDIELENPTTLEAYRRQMIRAFERFAVVSGKVSPEAVRAVSQQDDLSMAADLVATSLPLKLPDRQHLLELVDVTERLTELTGILYREAAIAEMEKEIGEKVRKTIERNQKEYVLREQMKAIQEELGEKDSNRSDSEQFLEKLEGLSLPDESRTRIKSEIDRLSRIPAGHPEASVLRSYLETVFELPWGKMSEERLDIPVARSHLERDHYGMEKVKERILEYLAVRKHRAEAETPARDRAPILCLIGPPGVGKTSIARSIAEAMGRRYVRMSLGGIRDEAEIRGHRKTYIGAMTGRILQAIRQVGTDNPLMLLDEIDKLGSDFRGDPSSALLEVLDPEQNFAFRDHYLEVPYDLSRVLFVTTANTAEGIPSPLFDRMEVVPVSGYTEEEKIEIALRHILPKLLLSHGLAPEDLRIGRDSLRALIAGYTHEAGVRQMERELAHLCRRVVLLREERGRKRVRIRPDRLEDLLGRKKYRHESAFEEDQVGVATGLAWTAAGGDTLAIEVNVLPGSGKLELTGSLGEIMKESARAAMTYIRSQAAALHLDPEFPAKYDIHIHVPEGATPKDGPSAGITLATALASALTGRPVRHELAMTGEITLRGRVLPIGGLKEKVVAAHRAGIRRVLAPEENRRDAADIPATVLEKVTLVHVSRMEQVLAEALAPKPEPPPEDAGERDGQLPVTSSQIRA